MRRKELMEMQQIQASFVMISQDWKHSNMFFFRLKHLGVIVHLLILKLNVFLLYSKNKIISYAGSLSSVETEKHKTQFCFLYIYTVKSVKNTN